MATVKEHHAIHRPAPPTPAIRACPELPRSASTASTMSNGSETDVSSRDSLGSGLFSRQSSDSYRSSRHSDMTSTSRLSMQSVDSKGRRRGYMRPQATDFAASARSRESVMSLGSIAHLQYYFARTGLLDGKGGQLARKRTNQHATLDMSLLDGTSTASNGVGSDMNRSYASMGSMVDLNSSNEHVKAGLSNLVESPIDDIDEDEFEDGYPESDPGMLPPTVSTYHQREKPIPKPPKVEDLKMGLETCLRDTQKLLDEVQARKDGAFQEPPDTPQLPNMPEENTPGWYELQGMRILDVVTLAIRAAKVYYTAHELPDRLDSIKSEKQIRADLLAVMEVLKQMATRNFKGGIKQDEIKVIVGWVESVHDILEKEHEIELAERAERESWAWLRGDWSGREYERERTFLSSMDPESELLPEWTPISEASECPTPFLRSLQNGLRLVNLHNAVVKKSRTRFGAIPTFHTDTQKPYRSADNLRYWVKAAELRFEVMLKVDALGVVYDSGPEAWQDFERAIFKWCKHVREEITSDWAE